MIGLFLIYSFTASKVKSVNVFGLNVIEESEKTSPIISFLKQFSEPLIILLIIAALLAIGLIYRHISLRKTRWYILVLAFCGWLIAFFCPLLFPTDLVSTFNNEDNLFHVSDGVLKFFWWTIYCAQFGLCYAIFPILQTYSIVGDFTFGNRLKRSIITRSMTKSMKFMRKICMVGWRLRTRFCCGCTKRISGNICIRTIRGIRKLKTIALVRR